MRTPAAEVDTSPALVTALLHDQHPDLAALSVTEAASGWDNALFRLGDRLSVRLPRREAAARLVRNEQRWLGPIAARVGVPVPAPVRVGRPGHGYPWHWSVTPWFDGRVAADVPVASRRPLAAPLAAFVNRLHVPAPDDAPANPVRAVPLRRRHDRLMEYLDGGRIPRARELRALWERLADAPAHTGPPLWVHGDLHPANLLVTSDGEPGLAAVLDFGDLTAGDPATDLATAWMLFDAPGRAAFRAALPEVHPHSWDRARAWAVVMGAATAAHSSDNPRMAAIGDHTLTQALGS
ncbi:aminoglycoside phosphotransferase (APT) family kinase protein [Nocardiopsis sp. Huas11]|uniref:aminoglycoside phosphotransferase family protein n=1 Tax=Nocardiopsis sp. Huas11 TaxID=2183912 RepID=UPI000EB566A3|nr:aminoglycoside phosphotransferase family protein [Nocardiopsis sp. Huas11]RKS07119.1 aminoglycoside phosphotransferase (APT) family kinase protein [Nocardiopsis sp. Huas11]